MNDKIPLTRQMISDTAVVKRFIDVHAPSYPVRLAFARILDAAHHSDRVLTIIAIREKDEKDAGKKKATKKR